MNGLAVNTISRPSANESAHPHEPDRRRRREGQAPACEQRQHDERDGGYGEPAGGGRLVRRVVPERDLEGALERGEEDQGVESVLPRECCEPRHTRNVLQAPTGRLLPR